ncbi:DNA/RNA helicase domain-containing protein [Asticcacaulis sp.]|uniref:DNA/RNA helicase domain-containing protein n=1 Tax=Asticcacaulis sp. TaxID=1872648 RepID=UPI002B7D3072|nr:DNA/RNA helicase domain-containing protein [Asticcacaulis sp.]HTM79737.1 DNA/RNA helicase domain-containing protein [Asticcacaulis sp.]
MRAYYTADRDKFYKDTPEHIMGELALRHRHDLEENQKGAWLQQIAILRGALKEASDFTLYFEFSIPRMGKRADAVVVIGDCIFVIEFKVGSDTFDRHAIEQVEDYALDLKNFHEGSHGLSIVPILVATKAAASRDVQLELALDQVAKPLCLAVIDLGAVIRMIAAHHDAPFFDTVKWAASGYRPTPTIVEAARALYARHEVADITRSDAGAINLGRTQDVIAGVIENAKAHHRKSICFVTGVPGAGKTLAGLNIATQRSERHADEHAVFLSGNGPLVDVLREALTRDQARRTGQPKAHVERKVRAFIQNIHKFRDEYVHTSAAPVEHVVVFDEAQRAWTQAKAASFMQQKRGVADFDMSEPEFLLSVMDRHADWCTVVCLIGGGQEINMGEAGMSEWMAAIRDRFPHWAVHVSAQIEQPDYDLNHDARAFIATEQVRLHDDLHLGVSMRSFRAETLSDFISHLLNGDAGAARQAHEKLENYPIHLTRDLAAARHWLRTTARGSERYGLVASSGAMRLRPEGLHVKAGIDPPNWFLNDRSDIRSSFYLEDVASEFDVQGLELDYVGVCWDADLRYVDDGWHCYNFKGTKWQSVNDRFRRLYLRNAYRVILTRARQGMVIFVPSGDDGDHTRPKRFYDETYAYLESCGLKALPKC